MAERTRARTALAAQATRRGTPRGTAAWSGALGIRAELRTLAVLGTVAALGTLAAFAVAPARADHRLSERDPNGPPAEFRVQPWSGAVPACDNPDVLKTLTKRFGHREKTYWNSPLELIGFEPLPRLPGAQLALRPWGASYIPRRFCQIRGHFNDGRARRIDYSVVEDASFIGWTWGVDFCVSGLDRHRAYAPDCEAARP